MSSAKILIHKPRIQFTIQISFLCDGKFHCKHIVNRVFVYIMVKIKLS